MSARHPGPEASRVPREKIRTPAPSGIARPRLIDAVVSAPPGLRLVEARAGSGKTTALAHAAASWKGPVVWATLDATDRSAASFTRTVAAAADIAGAADVLDVVAALDDAEPTLVVLDDVHELAHAPAAEALGLLCRYRPHQVVLALGARHLRGVDHWRFRVDGNVQGVTADDLRFRLWEVDELFRTDGDEPLRPDELHALTRVTEGWAVALHLFLLATRTAPLGHRRELLAALPVGSHSVRGYLTEQVLGAVSGEERRVLRRLAVLDHIDPRRAQAFLGAATGTTSLDELAAAGLLEASPSDASFSLHDLLRAHLLNELTEEVGELVVARLHGRAATIAEADGDIGEAIRACGRAGDWSELHRLLAMEGDEMAASGGWLAAVPTEVRGADPWVFRSVAMQQLRDGDLVGARAALADAVDRFAEHGGHARTERDLHLLDAWLRPEPGPPRSWVDALRTALGGKTVTTWPDGHMGHLAAGLAGLAQGRIASTRHLLVDAVDALDGTGAALALVGIAFAERLVGGDVADAADRAVTAANRAAAPALARAAQCAVTSIGGEGDTGRPGGAPTLIAALGQLFRGFRLLELGRPAARLLHGADDELGEMGLVVPAVLARCAAMLDRARRGEIDVAEARALESTAQAAGPLQHALCLLATAQLEPDPQRGADTLRQALGLADQHGFGRWLAALVHAHDEPAIAAPDTTSPVVPEAVDRELEVRCLGSQEVRLGGVVVDVESLRPRHQELLWALAVRPNEWIHRERLCEWLWPDAPPHRAFRGLQVAVSAVRGAIDRNRSGSSVIDRSGERYRFVVDPARSDVSRLEAATSRMRRAAHAGDAAAAESALREVLAAWRGDAVPAAGPADWAVERRRELQLGVGEAAAAALAAIPSLHDGGAVAARVVAIDTTNDALWRQAIDHATRAGDAAQSRALERGYSRLVTMA
jgi:DNA-binding SARP family transcriptional activator